MQLRASRAENLEPQESHAQQLRSRGGRGFAETFQKVTNPEQSRAAPASFTIHLEKKMAANTGLGENVY